MNFKNFQEFIDFVTDKTYDIFKEGTVVPQLIIAFENDGPIQAIFLTETGVQLREILKEAVRSYLTKYGHFKYVSFVFSGIFKDLTTGKRLFRALIIQAVSSDGEHEIKIIDKNKKELHYTIAGLLNFKEIIDEVAHELNI